MTTGKALNGKPYAGNPHVRFDEGEVSSAATPRHGSLLDKKQIVMFLVVAMAVAYVRAETWTDPDTGYKWTYRISGDTAEIYGTYHPEYETMSDPYADPAISPWPKINTLVIPSFIDGRPVTSIGNYAFWGCSDLTSVTIPASVTSIGYCAFWGCRSLSNVTIPANVTIIGDYVFGNCRGLTSVTIPDSVTSVGNYAFAGCVGLTSVTIPDSVMSIGDGTFSGCSGLTSVTIPDSVMSIGDGAFSGCSGLASVTIPDSVTSIGARVFNGCNDSLFETVNMPGVKMVDGWIVGNTGETAGHWNLTGVRGIGGGAFYNCSGLTSMVIPDGVKGIGDSAFYKCSGLVSVTIPDSVTSIGDYAFYNCSGLASVTIPDSVTRIGGTAFWGCRGLRSITIPGSVEDTGRLTFDGCSGLTNVTICGGVKNIGDQVFSQCRGLTKVTIPGSVTNIGVVAFAYCDRLSSVTIGDGVVNIGNSAFRECSALRSITIPDGVTSIGERAFYGCSGLTSLVISNGVENIGTNAFYGCSSLTSVTIPQIISTNRLSYAFPSSYGGIRNVVVLDGVTHIGSYAFYGCSALVNVRIPDSVVDIGENAFLACIESVFDTETIPGVKLVDGWAIGNTGSISGDLDLTGVRGIGYGAFNNCNRLTSVNIPDGVTGIGSHAFSGCSGLTNITIPDSVTSIGDSAFSGCSGLTSIIVGLGNSNYSSKNGLLLSKDGKTLVQGVNGDVVIPDGVMSIGGYAFDGCSGLTSVTIPDSVTNIGDYAFANCSGLMIVTIPDSVTNIGECAFSGCSGLMTVYIPQGYTGRTDMFPSGVTIIRVRQVVTFDATGGTVSPATNIVEYGSSYGFLPEPSRIGYTFAGWKWNDQSIFAETTVAALDHHTLSAQWSTNRYSVAFDANGGNDSVTNELDYASEIVAPDLEREGYTFTGWSPELDATVPASNVTYTAQWQINQYTVTFDANGGEGGWSRELAYGSAIVTPDVTREGYTFAGWSPEVAETVPVGGVTYVAHWTKIKLEFAENEIRADENASAVVRVTGGNLERASSVKVYLTYNTATAADLNLGKTKFPLTLKWEKGKVGEQTVTIPVKKDTLVEGEEFFTLQLAAASGAELGERTVCTVRIADAQECVAPAGTTVFTNATGTVMGYFTKKDKKGNVTANAMPGYVFTGWYDAKGKNVGAKAALADKTRKSKKATPRFAVAHYLRGLADPANGGKVTGSGKYAAGKKVTLKATPNKNWTFEGWGLMVPVAATSAAAPAAGYVSKAKSLTVAVTNELTYLAMFKPYPKVTVAVDNAKGGTVKGAGAYKTGTAVTLKATPKKGYAFCGWFDADGNLVSLKANYKYKVTADGLALSASFKKENALAKPVLTWDATNLTVGVSYSAKPTIVGESLVSVTKVTGLSKGLTFKSGKVSGVPTVAKAVTAKVTVALKSNAKKTWSYSVKLNVSALPTWAVGTFKGKGTFGGKDADVTLTVGKTGKISGKFVAVGKQYPFTASSFAELDAQGVLRTAKGTLKYGTKTCKVEIAVAEGEGGGEVEVVVTGGVTASGALVVP